MSSYGLFSIVPSMLSSIVPAILTYPPNGIIAKQYSVPLPVRPGFFTALLYTGPHDIFPS